MPLKQGEQNLYVTWNYRGDCFCQFDFVGGLILWFHSSCWTWNLRSVLRHLKQHGAASQTTWCVFLPCLRTQLQNFRLYLAVSVKILDGAPYLIAILCSITYLLSSSEAKRVPYQFSSVLEISIVILPINNMQDAHKSYIYSVKCMSVLISVALAISRKSLLTDWTFLNNLNETWLQIIHV